MGEERGFASLFGLMALGVLSFLAMAAFVINYKELETTQRFLSGLELQLEAQNGIIAAVGFIEGDSAVQEKISSASSPVNIFSRSNQEGTISCQVYAKTKRDVVILLAISQQGSRHRRAVAYLKRKAGRFFIDHWEH